MAAARQGARPANGAAEEMIVEAQELDESMRGADGVAGDVQGALCVSESPCHTLYYIF